MSSLNEVLTRNGLSELKTKLHSLLASIFSGVAVSHCERHHVTPDCHMDSKSSTACIPSILYSFPRCNQTQSSLGVSILNIETSCVISCRVDFVLSFSNFYSFIPSIEYHFNDFLSFSFRFETGQSWQHSWSSWFTGGRCGHQSEQHWCIQFTTQRCPRHHRSFG